ncbi:probable S-adenosylmethionine-dependent methyltransferase At5g38780 [Papaver somniferum]|uniref:probable S-adenosylmethionine-dependent methyltransferase At5g38780 n=1 Tax=Papaver somniferum TaxID=3469 RepID=UPI000E6FB4D0|nr:probable S-adenosylmethionine-dependent methyltransferase At5g38780 [Papaver somniferum]
MDSQVLRTELARFRCTFFPAAAAQLRTKDLISITRSSSVLKLYFASKLLRFGSLQRTQTSAAAIMAIPMNGGDGLYSYTKNCDIQKFVLDACQVMIEEGIDHKLDIHASAPKAFLVADLGCSVGPNTFTASQNIIQAVNLKYSCKSFTNGESTPHEYHVFFNDHATNDFNTLFTSLPPERQYLAAGVPGSFYTRLFPRDSVHVIHSSYALHWLSEVPSEVININSTAYNKGRIHYRDSGMEVVKAYSAQYAKDMEIFLEARAEEIVGGGLLMLVFPAIPNGTSPSLCTIGILFDLLGSCLMDMAKLSKVSEAKIDSFNLPMHTAFPEEAEKLFTRNESFSMERMEEIPFLNPAKNGTVTSSYYYDHVRAVTEGVIESHFGSEIKDELFEHHYLNKLEEVNHILRSPKSIMLFVLLKRKVVN